MVSGVEDEREEKADPPLRPHQLPRGPLSSSTPAVAVALGGDEEVPAPHPSRKRLPPAFPSVPRPGSRRGGGDQSTSPRTTVGERQLADEEPRAAPRTRPRTWTMVRRRPAAERRRHAATRANEAARRLPESARTAPACARLRQETTSGQSVAPTRLPSGPRASHARVGAGERMHRPDRLGSPISRAPRRPAERSPASGERARRSSSDRWVVSLTPP
jgi:hypothetical protein